MASLHTIPRFLLPRAPLLLRARPFPYPLLPLSSLRHASGSALPPRPEKPRVIPQPDKYRPPSHGRRTPRSETAQKSYGPELTEEDRKRMATKKYPNMMSPEGTFTHWFFHNKQIHVYISFGILCSLAFAAWFMDFYHKTIYKDMLPEGKDYLRHPITSVRRFLDVYVLHMEHTGKLADERRMKRFEDTERRRRFWLDRVREAEEKGEEFVIDDPRYYIDEEGVRRRRVKKWLGIWE